MAGPGAGLRHRPDAVITGLDGPSSLAGIGPSQRATTPLFGPRAGVEWHHDSLEEVFEFLLEHGCGLDAESRAAFSLHSFRIYLACALYAAKCPNDKICAILRWRSEDALEIYARMNDPERTEWVSSAMQQKVDSVTTANLPRLDPDDYIAALHASVASGELSRVARQADAGTVDEEEVEEAVAEDGDELATRARDLARQAARSILAKVGAPAAVAPPAAAVTWATVIAETTPRPMAADPLPTPAPPARPAAARTPSSGGLAALARQLALSP